ncbi:MAG: DUF6502 family protein [Pseudomonadota bacterium]
MSSSRATKSVSGALTPLLRILISQFRITYPTMRDALKEAFIDAAEDLIRTRPGSKKSGVSRVAVLSGVSTTDLRKINKLRKTSKGPQTTISPEAVILAEWGHNKKWLDRQGRPADLQLNGPYGEQNFSTLVRQSVGNIGYGAMAKILVEAGVASEFRYPDSRKGIRLLSIEYEPSEGKHLEMLEYACLMLQRLGRATEDNLRLAEFPATKRHFQHDYFSYKIPFDRLPEFRRALKTLLREFAYEKLVPEIEKFEISEQSADCLSEAGVGIYFWEKRKEEQELTPYSEE